MDRTLCIFILLPLLLLTQISFVQEIAAAEQDLSRELRQLKDDLEKIRGQYEREIERLEKKIDELSKERHTERVEEETPAAPRGAYAGLTAFNPKISVIGDFVGNITEDEKDELGDRFSVREVELAFSASVDPYARADFFLALEDEGDERHLDLEEGHITFLKLPLELQAKVGKFRSRFGRANLYHLHRMPWVDYPNMVVNFFGEEGMSEQGISVNRLIPNPWDQFMELTLEVFNNENEESFAGGEGDDLVYLAHLKSFFDFSQSSNFQLGLSYATGPNDEGHGGTRTHMQGVDLTYRWRPKEQGLYRSLVFQNEALFSQRDQDPGNVIHSLGLYSYLGYQFGRRWTAGLRYDYSEFPEDNDSRENGYSGLLTFQQSEFAFWRLQYKRTERNFDRDIDELWLQCNFGIGPHRAHEY